MTNTTDRVAKLPVWAQGLIYQLERERDEAVAQFEEFANGDVFVIDTKFRAARVPERMYLHPGERFSSGLRVRFEDGRIEISGNSPLVMTTEASNVLRVTESRR